VWQNFVEGGPLGGRHAAVIPALPEEYDASMPIGAYYPKREASANPNVPRGLSHYPQHVIAQAEAPSQVPQKRVTRSSNTSSSSAPVRNTRASTRVSQRQEQQEQKQQQKRPVSVSAPDTSLTPASEVIPTTFAGIMSQFPVPSVAETPHPAGS